MTNTRLPISPRTDAMFTADVVFPTPPLWLAKAIIGFMLLTPDKVGNGGSLFNQD
jgi:hypothetical protein